VATLFTLHQVAETQDSAPDFVAAPQEPATEVVTTTQKPVTPLDTPMTDQQPEPTMASLLQENEFLRSELEAYKQELVMAKEAYDRELNLYTLARVAAMAEKNTKDDQCREYMCSQCGDIYYQAGYKVVQIPMPGAPPPPTTFAVKEEEHPTVTQEPVGPSKIQKDEPWPTTTATSEAPVFISKVVQTLPIDESTPTFVEQSTQTLPRPTTDDAETQTLPIDEAAPPSKTSTSTLVEQATQTLPQPTTCDAETQTQPWNEQAIMDKWKKESAIIQDKSLQEHRLLWLNHIYSNWEALEQTRQESRAHKKQIEELKGKLLLMFDLVQKLLAARKPSSNYSLFLIERLTFFQIKSIKEGRPYAVLKPEDFVKTFAEASTTDQHLLCEVYLHNEAIPENRQLNLNPLVGDIQIRALVSFLTNQITWQNDFLAAKHNEDNRLLWIRPEPQNAATFVAEYYKFLKKPGMTQYIRQLQATILQDCQQLIKSTETAALEANNMFWQQSSEKRQEHNPFSPTNLETTISRVSSYIKCVQQCAENWIGYQFHFPILWMPAEKYQVHHKFPKKVETTAWQRLQRVQGFRAPTDNTFHSYCLSNLHAQSRYPDSDSD
jgi:hypothetical protein